MRRRLNGAFLDFGTLGPDLDTRRLDRVLQMSYYSWSSGEEVPDRLRDCEVAIVNKTRLSRPTLYAAEGLELIVLSATGVDNVDVAAARDRGIAVANIRDYCGQSVAQHVLALILALTQQVVRFDQLTRAGGWQRTRASLLLDHPMRELAGRTLGIVGYGSLGQAVARAGKCLGLEVLVSARPGVRGSKVPPGRVAFNTLLKQADIVSLHCPLTDETRNLIGAVQLERMKPDALLINTSRGGLVDINALLGALRTGQIAGAGLDVFPEEPPPPEHQQLLASAPPNLIVTPHVAWAAAEARQRALNQVAENIVDYLRGGQLRRVV
jgi:glycerate dehydrogenase